MAENDAKELEVKGLGMVTKVSDGKFKMSNADVAAYFKEHGVDDYQETLKVFNQAKSQFAADAVDHLLKPALLETKQDQSLRAGSGDGRIDVDLIGKVTRRNIQTGESYEVFGVVKTKDHWKSPFKPGDKNGRFEALSKEIEENFKRK